MKSDRSSMPVSVKVLGASVVGAVVGWCATAAALGSMEFALFAAVAGAVGAAISVLAQVETAEV